VNRPPEPDDVRLARSVMERHYREPVQPVTRYCERLLQYAAALDVAIQRHPPEPNEGPHDPTCGPFGSVETAVMVRDALRELGHWAPKSNVLGRLLYGDEPLRTRECPEHEGRWSGCHMEACPHGCDDGSNWTGWLRHDAPDPADPLNQPGLSQPDTRKEPS
jgi:hypothetical protein